MRALAGLALALVAFAAAGQEAPVERDGRRLLDASEAAAFRGIGRLNVAGTRFCTAALVSEREILTAAHCLFHPRTLARVPLSEFRFVPGQRMEENLGVRRVARAALPPEFSAQAAPRAADLKSDIALLELDAAVPAAAAPFAVGALDPGELALTIVSYARDRSQAPSISEDCPPLGAIDGLLVVGCAVERGVSGAPVLAGQGAAARIVAVVSGMGSLPDGAAITLTALAGPRLDALRASLAADGEAADAPER
ncbi:trypsin-like serine protease [Amaricoccus sp.]|uniref:trypsin-like serine peptidase n=1 Tax=Amaricoccus sp. TaxID=1872485 RepID=UPI001B663E00|nr:trypsin-like serine protease [Amaricoccus sp.]MBP7003446.1 trypsin-like serine protease [Amaricoccus sp.]